MACLTISQSLNAGELIRVKLTVNHCIYSFAREVPGDFLQRLLRGREADPGKIMPGKMPEMFEQKDEKCTAFVAGQGVNFINNNVFYGF